MDIYLCERNGYTERVGMGQIMEFPIYLKYVAFKCYIKCFSGINSFYEVNGLVL
jgi:hypothetical protein